MKYILLLLNLMYLACPGLASENWTEFRNGGPSSVERTDYPLHWGPTTGIIWQIETKGYGQSSPVIWHDKVIITSVSGNKKEECLVSCYQFTNGNLLWEKSFKSSQTADSNYRVSRAAPTPCIDQDRVYAFFETGELASLTHQGEILWQRSLTKDYGNFNNHHGIGSSLVQNESHLFLNLEHQGPSFLLAIDKKSGETFWKKERPQGMSWTTPALTPWKDKEQQLIVSSNGAVTSYRPYDGEIIWKIDGLGGNSVPSPLVEGHRIFIGARIPEFGQEGEAAKSNLCLNISGNKHEECQVLWRAKKAVSDYASPVISGDHLYFLNKSGGLYCLNKDSGEQYYAERLGGPCWATPVVVDDRIYFFRKDGITSVIKSGNKFDLISENHLWDLNTPPQPVSYKEYQSSETHAPQAGKTEATDKNASPPGRRRGGDFSEMLLKFDLNSDGNISTDELPEQFKEMFPRVDLNRNNQIDSDELKAMSENFRKQREDSQISSRDPLIYGVAASKGCFIVRTGTRLYCLGNNVEKSKSGD